MSHNTLRYTWLLFVLVCFSLPAWSSGNEQDKGIRPFVPGSFAKIIETRKGRPFIVALWSLDCPPCLKELTLWSKLEHPGMDIVLISTDRETNPAVIRAILQQSGNQGLESWVFAHDFEERLRFEIDPQWYGELPRTFLYNSDGKRSARSGLLDEKDLIRWIRLQIRPTP